jgi:threonine aldolase
MSFKGFGSDNHAGVHPEVLSAISAANVGHAHAYGDDPWTQRARAIIAETVGADSRVEFVWNGTGANVVGLSAVCRPWNSVVCPETAHINNDECGAPEHIADVKLIPVATPDGKLTPDLARPRLKDFGSQHQSQPRVISVSNATELGTAYTQAELRALSDLAHEYGMLLHVDGARLSNVAAAQGVPIAALTGQAGVDVLSFGGTKNGLLAGEAVVLLGDAISEELPFVRKQSAQLASKMRFVACQFEAMFGTDLWLRCAGHANEMAQRLAARAQERGVEIAYPVQANEVFALLPDERIADLQERFHFYTWQIGARPGMSTVRWVCSWDTEPSEVDALGEAL